MHPPGRQSDAETNWKKYYKDATTTGTDVVDNQPCYKVVLTKPDGTPETRYYSQDTGLLLRDDDVQTTDMGQVPVSSFMSDYKDYDGVKEPSVIKQLAANQNVEITLQKLESDPKFPDGIFTPPDDVKALLNPPATEATTEPASTEPK